MNTWKMMMRFIETSFLFSGWEETEEVARSKLSTLASST